MENAEPNSRLQKYFITDNFLNFWFRFLYRNYSAIETENFNYIKTLLKRDYLTYCGKILEKFYHELFAGTGKYNRIGSYWEKGNQNEIDLVAVNDMKKEIVVAEIKMNPSRINPGALKRNYSTRSTTFFSSIATSTYKRNVRPERSPPRIKFIGRN